MNPRNTGILLLVAAALGAFIYFYEIQGEAGRQEAEALTKRLFGDVDATTIDWLEFETSDGKAVRAERRAGAWHLAQPFEFPGDAFALDAIATALAEAASETVYENPQAAEVYGLGESAREFRFAVDAKTHVLRLGGATPMGGQHYAALPDAKPVYTVAGTLAASLERSLDDLRNHQVLDFERDAVTELLLKWPGGGAELVKQNGTWMLRAPRAERADAQTVEALLSSLGYLRASGFVDADPGPEATGLGAPALEVELRFAAAETAPVQDAAGAEAETDAEAGAEDVKATADATESETGGAEAKTDEAGPEAAPPARAPLQLAIGAPEGGPLHLKAALPTLYTLDAARLADFPRDLMAYRYKQLAKFEVADAQRLVLSFHSEAEGQSVVIEAKREPAAKTDAEGDADPAAAPSWSSSPEKMSPSRIEDLLYEVSDLRARSIAAEAMGAEETAALGLEPARVRLQVFGAGDSVLADLRFGELRDPDGVLAQSAENAQLFELDRNIGERVPLDLEAFRARFVEAPPAPPPTDVPAPTGADDAPPAPPPPVVPAPPGADDAPGEAAAPADTDASIEPAVPAEAPPAP